MAAPDHRSGKSHFGIKQKLFLLRSFRNQIDEKSLIKFTNSLFKAKIRYGLNIYGKIRGTKQDLENGLISLIQRI